MLQVVKVVKEKIFTAQRIAAAVALGKGIPMHMCVSMNSKQREENNAHVVMSRFVE